MKILTCRACNIQWKRNIQKGRLPFFCQDCDKSVKNINIPLVFPTDFLNKVVCGDSLTLIKRLPDKCADLIICSPPYFNQRNYTDNCLEIGHEENVDLYINKLVAIFTECFRVARDSGSIVFNLGDKHVENDLLLIPWRFALKAQAKTGAKIVNQIMWIKPDPTPRPQFKRMVSAYEPFFHFVKNNEYKYYKNRLTTKKINKNPQTLNIGKGYFRQIQTSDLSDEQKKSACAELQSAIDKIKTGKLYTVRMKIRGVHSVGFGGRDGGRKTDLDKNGYYVIEVPGNTILKDYIEIPVGASKGIDHPAIYPEELVESFIELLTDHDDLVLDPFIGSGTSAVVAKRMNRNYIGFDLSDKFVADANNRILQTQKDLIITKENKIDAYTPNDANAD